MKRIENINNIFSTYLGVEKNYRKVVVTQIYYIMWISFLILMITIVDGIWLRGKTTLSADFVVITVFHHPILLMLVADFTFCSFARYDDQRGKKMIHFSNSKTLTSLILF